MKFRVHNEELLKLLTLLKDRTRQVLEPFHHDDELGGQPFRILALSYLNEESTFQDLGLSSRHSMVFLIQFLFCIEVYSKGQKKHSDYKHQRQVYSSCLCSFEWFLDLFQTHTLETKVNLQEMNYMLLVLEYFILLLEQNQVVKELINLLVLTF